ncbi:MULTISPECIES: hypothetical protein [unclassified Mameliella]|uniref:hypothetical protein n=2 Tax=unclassified Mameliella TaxID=2630630 RepID=UPI002740212C|nr:MULTISPECIES: hypothetical protein [unclassified Mameliella]
MVKDLFINFVPPSSFSLSDTTMAAVLAELDSYGLTLTEEMVEGLYDLARSLELMAECQSARNLDPLSASKNDPVGAHGSWPDAV